MTEANHASHEGAAHQEHAELEADRMRVGFLAAAVAGIVLVIVCLVAFAVQYFTDVVRAETEEKIGRASPQLVALHEQEDAKLTKYQWVDQKAGIVRVPLERAMQLVVEDYQKPLPPPPAPAAPAPGAAPAQGANAAPANGAAPTANAAPANAPNAAPAKEPAAAPIKAPAAAEKAAVAPAPSKEPTK